MIALIRKRLSKRQPQSLEEIDTLPERAKKAKSKAIGRPMNEAYMRYVD
jgi:hypothetical protein